MVVGPTDDLKSVKPRRNAIQRETQENENAIQREETTPGNTSSSFLVIYLIFESIYCLRVVRWQMCITDIVSIFDHVTAYGKNFAVSVKTFKPPKM